LYSDELSLPVLFYICECTGRFFGGMKTTTSFLLTLTNNLIASRYSF